MLGYLSADIICSEWRTVFRERSSRKTVSYKEQIMSQDKYPSIFSPQMEAIVVIILQIFYATRAVLKIGEYPRIFPSFSWGIFTHVTRLDQSCASENIWWIITMDSKEITGDTAYFYLSSRFKRWKFTQFHIIPPSKQKSRKQICALIYLGVASWCISRQVKEHSQEVVLNEEQSHHHTRSDKRLVGMTNWCILYRNVFPAKHCNCFPAGKYHLLKERLQHYNARRSAFR